MARYRIRVNYSIEADSPDEAFRIWITSDKDRQQYLLFESLELVPTKHRGWLDEWHELDEEENSWVPTVPPRQSWGNRRYSNPE